MKKFIAIAMGLLLSFNSFAQTAYEKSKVTDNISLGVLGGVTSPLNFNSVTPFNAVAGLQLQKFYNPVVGTSVEGLVSFGDNNYANLKNAVKSINIGVNGLTNWSNLLAGYKGEARRVEVLTEAGIGYLHYYDCDRNYLSSKTGAQLLINLGKEKAHSLFVNPAIYWNLSARPGKVQFNQKYAQIGLMAGYAYHFKNSNGTHNFKVYDITYMNDEINGLRRALQFKSKEVVKVKEVVKTETVTNTIGNVVVFFAQNSFELTNKAKEELNKVPEGSHVDIIAEASPEGTKKYNTQLSKNRAKVVADYLVNNKVVVDKQDGIGSTSKYSKRVATIIIK